MKSLDKLGWSIEEALTTPSGDIWPLPFSSLEKGLAVGRIANRRENGPIPAQQRRASLQKGASLWRSILHIGAARITTLHGSESGHH